MSSVGSASDVHKRLAASRPLSGSAPVVAHYRLGPYLQQGGMATVFLGKRVAPGGFEKTVVLKKLHPELASQPLLLALFFGEARLAARLQHPCIVQALDVVQLDGDYYVVLEYVRGGDLRLLLRRAKRRGQQFSAAAGLYIGRELC
ncbi:MAG: protein kinase, partial [Deltaproteobacteria bacterium]|nr:protein kinase [Deltaproteobacteria bacterium]